MGQKSCFFVPREFLGRHKDPHSWIRKKIKLVNDALRGTSFEGVTFEDNLSSHRKEAVLKCFSQELSNFVKPCFLPEKMMTIIQVIDCHVGSQCKISIHIAFRNVIKERLNAAQVAVNGDMSVTIKPLKPK